MIVWDELYEDIFYGLAKGYTSAYMVWSRICVSERGQTLAYKNIAKRFIKLADEGLIERIEIEGDNLHGRKDYHITKKGKEVIRQHIHKLEQILSS